MTLDEQHNPKCYDCDEKCPWFGKCFYKIDTPLKNARLQNVMGGWQKYIKMDINDKECKLTFNGCVVINILHLINPMKYGDIVIFRIAKKNKNDNKYSIRYVCCQNCKTQLCASLVELNNHMDKKCDYVGRKIELEDFKNV